MNIFAGGGETGALMRQTDWAATPFGPVEAWPDILQQLVKICLHSHFPICIYWGPDMRLLYNDAWSAIPAEKHPWALGRTAREVWADIWPDIGEIFESVFKGKPHYQESVMLPMHRRGFTEECYFDYNVSPIYDDGGTVLGIYNTGQETTFEILTHRRNQLLRELAEKASWAESVDAAYESMVEILSHHPKDIPFGMFYMREAGDHARLIRAFGSPPLELARPRVEIDAPDTPWPFREVMENKAKMAVDIQPFLIKPLVLPPWPEEIRRAVVAPVASGAHKQDVMGFFVAGVSPRLDFDLDYKYFFKRLADVIAATIANARLAERERLLNTSLKNQLAEREAWLAQKDMLLNETNHRVKNTLATVNAIIGQTLYDDMPLAAARDALVARINALAKANDLLLRQNWESADIADIVDHTLRLHRNDAHNPFHLSGPALKITANAAQSFSLVLHELCTNGLKYGALSAPGGRIDIGWRIDKGRGPGAGSLVFEWRESGGPLVRPPSESGFGSQLIKGSFSGETTMDFAPGGLTVRIKTPLSSIS